MCASLGVSDRVSRPVKEVPTAAARVARGAALLDAVYGPKWFRTENVSLGEVRKQELQVPFILNRLEGSTSDTYDSDVFEAITRKAKEAGFRFRDGELFSDGSKFWGEAFGIFASETGPELGQLWANEIRSRRYNRPRRKR
jgi:hypothetical protein